MDAFYHSRIGVGTLLAFIGVLSHCDNIPTQCTLDHQVRSSITLVTTILNDIENKKEYFVVLWPEDAQTVSKRCGNRIFCVLALFWEPCQNIAVPFGARKPSVAVTIWVTRPWPSRHGALQQLQWSREPCSERVEKVCLGWILGQRDRECRSWRRGKLRPQASMSDRKILC